MLFPVSLGAGPGGELSSYFMWWETIKNTKRLASPQLCGTHPFVRNVD